MQLYDDNAIEWMHLLGDETFDYPIDYWAAVLNARADGHIDMLFRWAPSAYCHFHRHLVETTTTVLQGEHHLIDMDNGVEGEHRVRAAGDYSHKPPGEVPAVSTMVRMASPLLVPGCQFAFDIIALVPNGDVG